MNKTVIFTLSFLPLLALATDQNQTSLKGSDLISKDTGTIYTYTSANTPDQKFETVVENCNDNKTECTYQLRNYDTEGKANGYSEYTYVIKNGAVFQTNTMKIKDSGGAIRTVKLGDSELQDTPLFPQKIELNKAETSIETYDNYTIKETSKYTKLIPEITINRKTYKNCIQAELEQNVDYKNQPNKNTKYVSMIIYCKGVGEIYRKYSMLSDKGEYLFGQKDVELSLNSIAKNKEKL
ncbi:hypothetical protein IB633_00930 [Francisella philomiragia]|uniref:Uncharacterized protein n=1 Tax=Francisella philomiragia subsp. philomiragia (strain ATCC 25017 / CCUG 19701 / FSC 153 / O\|nr:hypothetical protein [Francisella philomiragia]AJI47567.1 hypothetical protein BF30_1715 [Francisella philomiragia]AJI49112.1 hypothetical protein KU46_1857 [Francisella philomiragia]MBK2019882.1 hypothetical protein [Francisella philomiragia]MBK2029667.1 hypothetical protein [Francisella philomiragia]MBK2264090.1 hypothetical protein [Francisella philomiragia]